MISHITMVMLTLLGGGPDDEVARIVAEHQKAVSVLDAERRKPKTTPAKIASLMKRASADSYAVQMLKIAEESPQTSAAFSALSWIVKSKGGPPLAASQASAAEVLVRDHLAEPQLSGLCEELSKTSSAAAETVLRAAYDKAPAAETRGRAGLALATYLRSNADISEYYNFSDVPQRKMLEGTPEGQAMLKRMAGVDARSFRDEAKEVMQKVASDFPDLKPPETQLGKSGPEVGTTAPEITGEDLDGKRMKLSDYRGKVVVIEFWGWWCVYCRAQIPPLNELADRTKYGDHFVVLGVNSDADPAAAKKSAKAADLAWPNWRSWRNDRSLAEKWNIQRWPTTCVIDHKGVVRYVGLTGQALADAIADLVKEIPLANDQK